MESEPIFPEGSVPVSVAARIYGKDASWIRAGIIAGWLPIGNATRNGILVNKIGDISSKKGRINYHISPKKIMGRNRLFMERKEIIMSRSELSEPSIYWLEKHRFYELRHFCLQYEYFRKMYDTIDGAISRSFFSPVNPKCPEVAVKQRDYFRERYEMIDRCARDTDPVLGAYVLKAVIEELSYDTLRAREPVPCCRVKFYEMYRKFFWLLDRERK